MRAPLVELYGEEYFRTTWEKWVDAFIHIYEVYDGDICRKEVKQIQCPLFVLHGDKDPLVAKEHPDYILDAVPNSRYIISAMSVLQPITFIFLFVFSILCFAECFIFRRENTIFTFAMQKNLMSLSLNFFSNLNHVICDMHLL